MTAQPDHAATWLHTAAHAARLASATLARSPEAARNAGLHEAAAALRAAMPAILAANEADLAASQATPAFRDRLTLTPDRVEAMAARAGGYRGPARPARPHAGRVDTAQRAALPPHRRPARRDRHDL